MTNGREKCDFSSEASMSVSRPPAAVALVNAAGGSGASGADWNSVAFLLNDFEEAYRAYAHEMAQMFGVADRVTTPCFVRVTPGGDDILSARSGRSDAGEGDAGQGDAGRSDAERGIAGLHDAADSSSDGTAAELSECDAVVVGYACGAGRASVDGFAADVARLSPSLDIPSGARVYAIAIDSSCDAGNALASVDVLHAFCRESGLRFSGGIAIGGGALLSRMENKPRMGAARRRLSEATDELIEAVCAGRDTEVVTVRPPMPRFLYGLLV